MPVHLEGFSGGDRTKISLPPLQEDLLQAVAATGKPLVVVLMNGSALAVPWAKEHAARNSGSLVSRVKREAPPSPRPSPATTIRRAACPLPSMVRSISFRRSKIIPWPAAPTDILPGNRSMVSALASAIPRSPTAI